MQYLRYKPRSALGALSRGAFWRTPTTPTATPTATPTPAPAPAQVTTVEAPQTAVIPYQFRYTKEQLADMLIRGQSEQVERTGEDENGLPFAEDLEQTSRERDATAQFGVDAQEGLFPTPITAPEDNKAVGWIVAAVLGYFLLGV